MQTETVTDLATATREQADRVQATARAAIAAHDAHDAITRAYREFNPDYIHANARAIEAMVTAQRAPEGPLLGVPVSVKDLLFVRGFDLYAGSPKPLPPAWRHEGPVIRRLHREGALITGKTHTVEFAFGGIGSNPHWPVPGNPWSTDGPRAPGGSSSGAGISLLEGSARIALGSDTAGSVRVPASLAGVAGLKTSWGRWSLAGVVPLSPSLDTVGILAPNLRDLVAAFVGLDPAWEDRPVAEFHLPRRGLAGLRLAWHPWFLADCQPDIERKIRQAMDHLANNGVQLYQIDWPELDCVYDLFRTGGIAAAQFAHMLNRELPEWKEQLDPNVRKRFSPIENLPAGDYLARKATVDLCTRRTGPRLASFDAVIAPTVGISAPRLADLARPEAYIEQNLRVLRNCSMANLLGLCALTLPCGKDDLGLPVGLMLMAPGGMDEHILRIGCEIEDLLGSSRQLLGVPPLLSS